MWFSGHYLTFNLSTVGWTTRIQTPVFKASQVRGACFVRFYYYLVSNTDAGGAVLRVRLCAFVHMLQYVKCYQSQPSAGSVLCQILLLSRQQHGRWRGCAQGKVMCFCTYVTIREVLSKPAKCGERALSDFTTISLATRTLEGLY